MFSKDKDDTKEPRFTAKAAVDHNVVVSIDPETIEAGKDVLNQLLVGAIYYTATKLILTAVFRKKPVLFNSRLSYLEGQMNTLTNI